MSCSGTSGRLLEPLNFNNFNQPGKVGYRGAALIAPMPSKLKSEKVSEKESHVILDRVLLEELLVKLFHTDTELG